MKGMLSTILVALGLPSSAIATEPSEPCDAKTASADPQIAVVIAVVCQMIDAWNKMDWKRSSELFAEDGVLASMMVEPVVGRAAIDKRVRAVGSTLSQLNLRIVNIGRVGDVVFLERVDEFIASGRKGAIPVVGVFEIRDGKVKVWREYFDRAMMLRELGIKEDLRNEVWTPM
jgi:limonene-1,2-epoxide hydrolase